MFLSRRKSLKVYNAENRLTNGVLMQRRHFGKEMSYKVLTSFAIYTLCGWSNSCTCNRSIEQNEKSKIRVNCRYFMSSSSDCASKGDRIKNIRQKVRIK